MILWPYWKFSYSISKSCILESQINLHYTSAPNSAVNWRLGKLREGIPCSMKRCIAQHRYIQLDNTGEGYSASGSRTHDRSPTNKNVSLVDDFRRVRSRNGSYGINAKPKHKTHKDGDVYKKLCNTFNISATS